MRAEKEKKAHSAGQFAVHQIPLRIFIPDYPTNPPVRANRDFPNDLPSRSIPFLTVRQSAIVR